MPPAASPTTVPPPPLAPRTGEIRDTGPVRRESVRAQRWTTSGPAKVLGDVEVDAAELAGLVTVRGGVSGGSVSVHGGCDIGGAVRLSGAFRTDGTLTIGRGLEAAEVDLAGAASIAEGVHTTGRVRWSGTLQTIGGITAPRVEFHGRGAIAGAVVATEVVGRLRGRSKIGSIRADRVTITQGARLLDIGHLEVLTIEAREVDIEAVQAHHVRAERIALGPGCQIASVEGTITRQHPSAHVGPASHSAPPFGLSR